MKFYLRVSGVMGPVAVGLAGPRLLSEEEEETEPLRADVRTLEPLTPLMPPTGPPADPEATHCDCLHAALVLACRDDLSGKAPSKYQQHPHTSILATLYSTLKCYVSALLENNVQAGNVT